MKGPTDGHSILCLLDFSQERKPTDLMEESFPGLHCRSRFQWFKRYTGVDTGIYCPYSSSGMNNLIVLAAENAAEQTSALSPF